MDQPKFIIATLMVLLAAAVALERTRLGKVLPGAAIMLIGSMGLATVGVLPHRAPAHDQLADIVVPMGVFLLLLRADFRAILRETGALMGLYVLGAIGSVVGIVVAWLAVPVAQADVVASAQLANLVGGTMNVVVVSHALNLQSSNFTAMMAAAAIMMNAYLLLIGIAAANPMLQRFLPGRSSRRTPLSGPDERAAAPAAPFDALSTAVILALAVVVYAVTDAGAAVIGRPELQIIFVSLIGLACANIAPRAIARVFGDREVGGMLMYLFFATFGVGVDLGRLGPAVGAMAVLIAVAIIVHLTIIILGGRLLGASLPEVLVASVAGVGGPSTAAAITASLGARDLVTPGLLCGLLGFAAATFLALGGHAPLAS